MAVLGAVVGDILGSSFEYNKTTEPMTCELIVDETTFTDDTVMTLAIKKAIDTDKDFTETMRELGSKYPWCGYGNHFFEWIFCTNPRCFYESTDYISFIRNVLSLDCDADTLCAIGGAVAEEFYGGTGINNEKLLQDILEEELLDIFYGRY